MRKLRLTPMQRDILWMLEEAGEENMPCIRTTLHNRDELEFERQVDGLQRLGFVYRWLESGSELPSLVLTSEGRSALTR
jgi:hypothetical protein